MILEPFDVYLSFNLNIEKSFPTKFSWGWGWGGGKYLHGAEQQEEDERNGSSQAAEEGKHTNPEKQDLANPEKE